MSNNKLAHIILLTTVLSIVLCSYHTSEVSGIKRNPLVCNDLSRMVTDESNVVIEQDPNKKLNSTNPTPDLQILADPEPEPFFTTKGNLLDLKGLQSNSTIPRDSVSNDALCRATGNNILVGNPNSAAFNHDISPETYDSGRLLMPNPNSASYNYNINPVPQNLGYGVVKNPNAQFNNFPIYGNNPPDGFLEDAFPETSSYTATMAGYVDGGH